MAKNEVLEHAISDQKVKKRGQWGMVWRRLKRNKMAMFGLGIIVLLLIIAIVASYITPSGYDYQVLGDRLLPPGTHFETEGVTCDVVAGEIDIAGCEERIQAELEDELAELEDELAELEQEVDLSELEDELAELEDELEELEDELEELADELTALEDELEELEDELADADSEDSDLEIDTSDLESQILVLRDEIATFTSENGDQILFLEDEIATFTSENGDRISYLRGEVARFTSLQNQISNIEDALPATIQEDTCEIDGDDEDSDEATCQFITGSTFYLFGTDHLGRDIYTRIVYGACVSLQVGLISISIATLIGGLLGAIAGYYGGHFDTIVMRFMDVLLAIPGILLAISIVAALGPGIRNVMIAVGIGATPVEARVIRASVMQVRDQEFVEAAKAVGTSDLRIVFKHILPNAMAQIIVQATLGVAGAILAAAGLSFIGLGIQPPSPEWGAMLSEGRQHLRDHWHVTTFPGIAIMTTIFALNLLGDGLRDALDPKLKN